MTLESSSVTFPSGPGITQSYDYNGRTYSKNGVGWKQQVPAQLAFASKERWLVLTADFTLISQTAAQNMFPTGGFMVGPNLTCFFETVWALTSLAASGAVGFAFGGSATITRQKWQALGDKQSALVTPPNVGTEMSQSDNTAANTAISQSNANTTALFSIFGILRIGAAGFLIPQISLGTGAAAVVNQDSYFRMIALGADTARSSDV